MVSLDTASTMVDAALHHGRALGCAPLTVAVLDPGGHLLVLKRQDGSGILRPQIAQAKAWGALGMGTGSRALAERAATAPAFFTALAALSEGRIVPAPGGVLVRDGAGAIVAAVGVSGDNPANDEACAVVGIQTAGLAADPGGAGEHAVMTDQHRVDPRPGTAAPLRATGQQKSVRPKPGRTSPGEQEKRS
jgi:uncharacterized protein GlcG (DUF336 family)